MQPLIRDHGIIRFKENKIVCALLEFSRERGFGLNEIAERDFPRNDREQFAQLIGYSLYGASDLSYMRRTLIARAERAIGRKANAA